MGLEKKIINKKNTQGELVVIFPSLSLSLSLLSNSPQRVCVSVHVLNSFLFSLVMMGNFCFLQVPRFVARNFYCFNNEGYLLVVFKMRFFLPELCLYILQSTNKSTREM